MATLDDKLLGEKLHYYCSSSESDDDDDGKKCGGGDDAEPRAKGCSDPPALDAPDRYSVNTGPKGVLNDWRRFKQLETEKRQEQERERLMLIKKLSLTCRSDDEPPQPNEDDDLDREMAELLQDEFLKQYTEKRMAEMHQQLGSQPRFGRLVALKDGTEFLEAVDEKHANVIVHLYKDQFESCEALTGCLSCLAQDYPQVKFCTLKASSAGVSEHFQASGVPALLVYKRGQLVGNFVRLRDDLGDDFFASDVECFLTEHGMLPDKSLLPSNIRVTQTDTDV